MEMKSVLKTPYQPSWKPTFFKCGLTVGMTLTRDMVMYVATQLKDNPTWVPAINLRTVADDGFIELIAPEWMKILDPKDVDTEIATMQKFIHGDDYDQIDKEADDEGDTDDCPF